jgi:hypothetical protein
MFTSRAKIYHGFTIYNPVILQLPVANVALFRPRLKGLSYLSEVPRIWVTAGRRKRPTIQSAATRALL